MLIPRRMMLFLAGEFMIAERFEPPIRYTWTVM
jgi:hypothetical protein